MSGSSGSVRSWRPPTAEHRLAARRLQRLLAVTGLSLLLGSLTVLLLWNLQKQPRLQAILIEVPGTPQPAVGTLSAPEPQSLFLKQLRKFFEVQRNSNKLFLPPVHGTWQEVSQQLTSPQTVSASRIVYLRTTVRTENPSEPQQNPKTEPAIPWVWLGDSDWRSLPDLLQVLQPASTDCQTLLFLELRDVVTESDGLHLDAGLPATTWDAIASAVKDHDAAKGRIRVITACSAGERCWEQLTHSAESQATTVFQAALHETLVSGGRDAGNIYETLRKKVQTATDADWHDTQTLALLEPDNYAEASEQTFDWLFTASPASPSVPTITQDSAPAAPDSADQTADTGTAGTGLESLKKNAEAAADAESIRQQLTEQLLRLCERQTELRSVSDNPEKLWQVDQKLFALSMQIPALQTGPTDVQGLQLQLREIAASLQNSGGASELSEQLQQQLTIFAFQIDDSRAEKLLNILLSTPEYSGELEPSAAKLLDWYIRRLESGNVAEESRAGELTQLSLLIGHSRWKSLRGLQLPVWLPLLKKITLDTSTSNTVDRSWEQLQAFLRLEQQRREICRLMAGFDPAVDLPRPLPLELLSDSKWRYDHTGTDRCVRTVQLLTTAESWLGHAGFDGLRNLEHCCDEADVQLQELRNAITEQSDLLKARRLQFNEAPLLRRYFAQAAVEEDILPVNLEQLRVLSAPITAGNWRDFEQARKHLRQHIQNLAGQPTLTARQWRWLCQLPLWDLPELAELRKHRPEFKRWNHKPEASVSRITATTQRYPELRPSPPIAGLAQPERTVNSTDPGSPTTVSGVAGLRDGFFASRTMLSWERPQLSPQLAGSPAEEPWLRPLKDIQRKLQEVTPADKDILEIPLPDAPTPDRRLEVQILGDMFETVSMENGLLRLRRLVPPLAEARTLSLLLTTSAFPNLKIPIVWFRSDLTIQPRSEYAWAVHFRPVPDAASLERQGAENRWRLPLPGVNKPLPLFMELEKTAGPPLKLAKVRLRGINREASEAYSKWTPQMEAVLSSSSETGLQTGPLKLILPGPLDISDGLELEISAVGSDGNLSGAPGQLVVKPYLPLPEPADAPRVQLNTENSARLEISPPTKGGGFRISFSPQIESRIAPEALQAKTPLKSYEFKEFSNWEPGAVYEVLAFWPPQQWLWDLDPRSSEGQREVSAEGQHVRILLPQPEGLQRIPLPRRIMVDEYSEYLFKDASPAETPPAPPAPSFTAKLKPEIQLFGFAEDSETRKFVVRLIRLASDGELLVDSFSQSFQRPCRQKFLLTSDEDGKGVITATAELWNLADRPFELVEPGRYRLTAEVSLDSENSPVLCQSSVDLIWDRKPPTDFRVDFKEQPNGKRSFTFRNLQDEESGLESLIVRPSAQDPWNISVPLRQQSLNEWEWDPTREEWARLDELAASHGGQLTMTFWLNDAAGHQTEHKLGPIRLSMSGKTVESVPGPRSILVQLPPNGQWRVQLQPRGQAAVERQVGPLDSRKVLFSGLGKSNHTLRVQKRSDGKYSDYINRTIKETEISDEGPLEIPVSD